MGVQFRLFYDSLRLLFALELSKDRFSNLMGRILIQIFERSLKPEMMSKNVF